MKSGEIVSCIQILIGGGDIALMTWRTMSLPTVWHTGCISLPFEGGSWGHLSRRLRSASLFGVLQPCKQRLSGGHYWRLSRLSSCHHDLGTVDYCFSRCGLELFPLSWLHESERECLRFLALGGRGAITEAKWRTRWKRVAKTESSLRSPKNGLEILWG